MLYFGTVICGLRYNYATLTGKVDSAMIIGDRDVLHGVSGVDCCARLDVHGIPLGGEESRVVILKFIIAVR